MEDKCLLKRMEIERRPDPFNRRDLGIVVDPLHLHGAGTDQFAVEDHVAGAALAGPTADFDAGQMQLLAQHIGQQRFLVNDQRPLNAIDIEYLLNHTSSSFWCR